MPYDADLIILEGVSALKQTFVASVVATWGMTELKGTPSKGLSAVMIAPRINVTYLNYMTGHIEVSDGIAAGWERIASFPTLYQYLRKIPCICTAVPVLADVGKYLYGGTSNDDGMIRSFDEELHTVGGKGYVYVSMVNATDTYDEAAEAFTTHGAVGGSGAAGTFAATATAVSKAVQPGGIRCARFATKKRYVRFNATLNGNFQAVIVGIVPWPQEEM